jgi:uncharacterized protein YjiS (DUF1127 family)
MTTYVAIQPDLQSTVSPFRQRVWLAALRWLADYRALAAERRTRKALARLDRATLEDIGVPHTEMSLRAGPLTRYPEMITVREPDWRTSLQGVGGRR